MNEDMSSVNNLTIDPSVKEKFKILVDEEIFSPEEICNSIHPTLTEKEPRVACILISRLLKKISETDPVLLDDTFALWTDILLQPVSAEAEEEKLEVVLPVETISHIHDENVKSSLDSKTVRNDAIRRQYGKGDLNERVKALADELGWEFVVSKLQRRLGPKKQPHPNSSEYDQMVDEANMNEVFLGRLSTDVYEDEIYDLVASKVGAEAIVLIRVMTSREGVSRGYAFVRLQDKETCFKVIRALNDYSIRPRYQMKVNYSPPNVRLHVSNIPKSKTKDELKAEFQKITDGLKEVHVHQGVDKNRGFCFVDYLTHQSAKAALRQLNMIEIKVFNRNVTADWAEPFEEVDPEIMAKVRTLYVKNIAPDVSSDMLMDIFTPFGPVESIRKNVDYAFVLFDNREDALKAIEGVHQRSIGHHVVDVSLARPHEATRRDTSKSRLVNKKPTEKRVESSVPVIYGSERLSKPITSSAALSTGGGRHYHSLRYYEEDHYPYFPGMSETAYRSRDVALERHIQPDYPGDFRNAMPSNDNTKGNAANFYEDSDDQWYGGINYLNFHRPAAMGAYAGATSATLKRPGSSLMTNAAKNPRNSYESGR